LLIDGDYTNASLTIHFQVNHSSSLSDVLCDLVDIDEAIIPLRKPFDDFKGIDMIPTCNTNNLRNYIQGPFVNEHKKIKLLFKKCKALGYDFVIYDMIPALDLYTYSVMEMLHIYIPVVNTETYASRDFKEFLLAVKNHREMYEAQYLYSHAFMNRFRGDIKAHTLYKEQLLRYPLTFYVIKDSNDIINASTFKKFIQELKPNHASIEIFDLFAKNIIEATKSFE